MFLARVPSITTLARCSIRQGGGAYVTGRLTMKASRLKANRANTEGANLYLSAGSTTAYLLPAPPGYWVPAIRCEIWREACPCVSATAECDACKSTVASCKMDATNNIGNCNSATDSASSTGSCQSTTPNQPCDWRKNPALLGETVYVLPLGSHDVDFPSACAAGVLGGNGSLVSEQTSAACAGLCPAGFTCGTEATVAPAACLTGHYCPKGTSVAIPCKAGSYSNSTKLTKPGQCMPTEKGHSAPAGGTKQTPCAPGTVAPNAGMGACDECKSTDRKYQPSWGKRECMVCGAGSYSSNDLSCEQCQVGEYCEVTQRFTKRCPFGFTTRGRGAKSEAECGCFSGQYEVVSEKGIRTCETCSQASMMCNETAITAFELPVAPGYWRQHKWSAPGQSAPGFSNYGSVLACHTKQACMGGVNLSADVFCAPSQKGPYCAVCRDGYFGGGDGALCEPCEGQAAVTFLPIIIIVLICAVLLALHLFTKDAPPTKSSKLAVDTAKKLQDADTGVVHASTTENSDADDVATELQAADTGVVELRSEEVGEAAGDQMETAGAKATLVRAKGTYASDLAIRRVMEDGNIETDLLAAMETDRLAEVEAERLLNIAVRYKKFSMMASKTKSGARWLKTKAADFGVKLKILIALYQMLQGLGMTFNIRWPVTYSDALHFLGSIVQIDIPQAMPIACIAPIGFFGALVIRTALPLLVIMMLAGLSKLFKLYEKENIAKMLSSGWFFVLFLVYPSCVSAIFQAFMCYELDDGSAYLRVDYSVQCYAENKGAYSEDYKGVMAYAILMTFIYPLGTPLLYVAVLYANLKKIAKVDRLERPLMKFIGSPKTEGATGIFYQSVHDNIRENTLGSGGLPKLTDGYEMKVYWFEVFECVRKICLIGLPIFFEPGSSAQLITGLLVCFLSYGMYSSYEPYIKDSDDLLAKVCQVSLFFSLVSSIALKMEPDKSTEALEGLLVFMLMVPPVLAFLFESDLDFEKGCNVPFIKEMAIKEKVVKCFTSTLGSCFDRCFNDEVPSTIINVKVPSSTGMTKWTMKMRRAEQGKDSSTEQSSTTG